MAKVSVEGGTLIGLGNACSYNARGYLTDETDTNYGEALAVIRPNGEGTILVKAESPHGECSAQVHCKKRRENIMTQRNNAFWGGRHWQRLLSGRRMSDCRNC